MWALPLGGDTYEIRNVPFYAYGLNFLDVVEAASVSTDLDPSIRRVVGRSGHRTLRVIFRKSTPEVKRVPLLQSLNEIGASFERATSTLFAIDVEDSGDYQAVCDRLFAFENEGLLAYETCEARLEGSFDDLPQKP